MKKKDEERRSHARLQIEKDAFAVVKPGDERRLVQIENISLGGLAFRYITSPEWENEVDFVDIMLLEEEVYLEHVPVKMVIDQDTAGIAGAPDTDGIRQRSVKFDRLSSEQKQWLEHFIRVSQSPLYEGPERRRQERRSGLDRRIVSNRST